MTPSVVRVEVEINGFSPGGAWLFHVPVPDYHGAIPSAPLNIMRAPDGAGLIVFPVMYRPPGSTATIVRLFAYSLTGSREADVSVNSLVTPIEGEWNAFWADFSIEREDDDKDIEGFRFPWRVARPLQSVRRQAPCAVAHRKLFGAWERRQVARCYRASRQRAGRDGCAPGYDRARHTGG